MSYTIVKHAGSTWGEYFSEDPKEDVVHPSYSCHKTYTAEKFSVKQVYENHSEATEDCKRLNEDNPVGDYAVCKLMENAY